MSTEKPIKTVAVFGGSSLGNHPDHEREMRRVGSMLAHLDKELWVGSRTGVLGALTDSFCKAGGKATLFLTPHNDKRPAAFIPIGMKVVDVERDNDRTIELLKADAWISGSGSGGSFGETVRAVTWNLDRTYRGSILTPHFLLNVRGIYSNLAALYANAVNEGFGKPETLQLFKMLDNAEALRDALIVADYSEPLRLDRVSAVAP